MDEELVSQSYVFYQKNIIYSKEILPIFLKNEILDYEMVKYRKLTIKFKGLLIFLRIVSVESTYQNLT